MSTPTIETTGHVPDRDAGAACDTGPNGAPCATCPQVSWPCIFAIRDVIARHPGISSDDLVEAVRPAGEPPLARRGILDVAHRGSRSHGLGQLVDGTWWTADDNAEVAARCAQDLPSPGAEMYYAYWQTPLGAHPGDLRDWGLRHG